jgi:hypothetical protein
LRRAVRTLHSTPMAMNTEHPRDERERLRLTQLSHGAG